MPEDVNLFASMGIEAPEPSARPREDYEPHWTHMGSVSVDMAECGGCGAPLGSPAWCTPDWLFCKPECAELWPGHPPEKWRQR